MTEETVEFWKQRYEELQRVAQNYRKQLTTYREMEVLLKLPPTMTSDQLRQVKIAKDMLAKAGVQVIDVGKTM